MCIYVHDGLPHEGELDLSANLGELLGVVAEDAEVLGVDVRLALRLGGGWRCVCICCQVRGGERSAGETDLTLEKQEKYTKTGGHR